jgi:hypothetical protein
MRAALAPVVCAKVWTYQQHRGASCADQICENGANGKERRIHQWRSRELAFDVDAAGNDKQRTQQHHERNVVD